MYKDNVKQYKNYIKSIFSEWDRYSTVSQETKEIAAEKVIKRLQKEDKGIDHPGAQKVLKNYIIKEVLA